MRVLLGGLIGAIVSAAAWFFLEYITVKDLGWLAIGVGLITGLCIHKAAGAGAAESYGRGALAVLLTMLAIVGGRAAYVKVIQNVTKVTTIAPAEKVAAVDERPAEAAADGEAPVDVEPQPEPSRRGADGNISLGNLPKPTVSSYEDINFLWMAVAALAAYVVGKGSGKAAPPEAESPRTEDNAEVTA